LNVAQPIDVPSPKQHIIRPIVFFVEVAGFTFEFHSLREIQIVLAYFSQKVRPSSRSPYPIVGMSHWEAQQWHDRIPGWLLKEPRRIKVVTALSDALREFGKETPKAR
jgi:hypothetical protein